MDMGCKMEKKKLRKRLVLFPLPLQGHQNPMLNLAEILHSKGFSISIIHTQFNSPNSTNYPHFRFYPIPGSSFQLQDTSSDHVLGFVQMINVDLVVPFRDVLLQILLENNVCCLITDALWHFTQDVADKLNLSTMVLRTSNTSSFVCFTCLSLLREKGYLEAQGSELEEIVPEFPPLKVKDIVILGTKDREAAYEFARNLIERIKASKGVIFNSFEELEGSSLTMIRKNLTTPIFTLGPFHKQVPTSSHHLLPQDQSCISWLNTHPPKSVLYVSFGSLISIDEEEFKEIAWGLVDSIQPFLWVIRPGLVRGSNGSTPLPNGFLEMVEGRGLVTEWAAQKEVLAHPAIGGFWTHCGWNSTLESICEGVPMLCLPAFGDQRTNARYITDVWKVGLEVEKWQLKRQEIAKAIIRLMVEKDGGEIRERITCLKEKSSLCIAEGGSSLESLDNLVDYILSF